MSSLSSLATSQPQELLEEETLKRLPNGYSFELITSARSIALVCSKGQALSD